MLPVTWALLKIAYSNLSPAKVLVRSQSKVADNDQTIFCRNSLTSGSISIKQVKLQIVLLSEFEKSDDIFKSGLHKFLLNPSVIKKIASPSLIYL